MINKVILTGRLTADPELRYTTNGVPFTIFTLAVDRIYTNSEGERDTDFIDIMTWRKLAESCAQYLSKGSLVAVDGRLQIRKNKKDEKTYINPEVVAANVQFMDFRGNKDENKEFAEVEETLEV